MTGRSDRDCSTSSATVAPGKTPDAVEKAILDGDRKAEDNTDRALGAREGAQQRQARRRQRPDQLADEARTLLADFAAELRRPGADQPAHRPHRAKSPPPTCSAWPARISPRRTAPSSSPCRSRPPQPRERRDEHEADRHDCAAVFATAAVGHAQAPAGQDKPQAVVMKGKAPVNEQRAARSSCRGRTKSTLQQRAARDGARGSSSAADHHAVDRCAGPAAISIRPITSDSRSSPPRTYARARPARRPLEIAEQLERLAATLAVNTSLSDEDATISASALTEQCGRSARSSWRKS